MVEKDLTNVESDIQQETGTPSDSGQGQEKKLKLD